MYQAYKRIFSLGSVYAIGSLLEKGQAVFLLPVYSSFLGAKDFGVLALLALLGALITKAIISPITTSLSRFYYKPDWSDRRGLLVFNLFWYLGVQCVVALLVYWSLSSWFAEHFLGDAALITAVWSYGFLLLLNPLASFFTSLVRLREMSRYYVVASLFALSISVGVILYYLIVRDAGLLALIYGEIWRSLLLSLACMVVWFRVSKFQLSAAVPGTRRRG